MRAVQRNEGEKRVDGGKKKEVVDDPHTSAAKQKRPLRCGIETLLAERPSCICFLPVFDTTSPGKGGG